MNRVCRIAIAILLMLPMSVCGRNRVYAPQIKSLQSVVNGDWLSYPTIMRFGSDNVLHISFDELSHEYHRYIYRLEHCENDWTRSEDLFDSDWLEGFNDNTIDDYTNSINTIVPYTHYQFDIPNDRCRLKMSGNYRLYIIDEDSDPDTPVAMVEFMLAEQAMNLQLGVSTNTDIDTNDSHQQVSMSLNFGNILVTNPAEQIYCRVMQNGREDNMKENPMPDYRNANGLEWTHNRALIFDAGNEYRKFEVLDVSHPTMGIESIRWDGANYQAFPYLSEPRMNYLYDEDANGAFFIRNSDNRENDVISEYVWVNYRLRSPRMTDASVIIDGHWTTDDNTYNYMMEYDEEQGLYTCKVLQKQGYYSYQYLCRKHDDSTFLLPSEGNFYQTENNYRAFIYYKGTGDRTWRLISYRSITLK